MPRALPPLGWFRAFEAAARRESFTRAADELGLTQSAVSQQIRLLESRLGCRLFVRKPRGIALTDEGRRLLPDVTVAIGGLRSAVSAFEGPEQAGLLTVATSVSIAQWYLAPRLGHFLDANPGTSLRIVSAVWPDEQGESRADVRIRFGPEPDKAEAATQLGSSRMVLVAAPKLLNSKSDIHLTELQLRERVLIQAVGTADLWARHAELLGHDPKHLASLHVDSHGLAVDLARAGTGIAFTSESIALPSLRDGSLVRAHPESIDGRDGYWISNLAESRETMARTFIDWLTEQVNFADPVTIEVEDH